jgi:DHA1 family multidrug resistance protein-like MFS transporter
MRHRSLAIVALGAFALSASQGILFALLADLQTRFGLPTWGLGMMTAASFLTAVIVQLAFAQLADRGYTRALLTISLALATGALVWLATSTELWEFVAARAVQGIAIGLFAPAARALAATIDDTRQAENLGRLEAVNLAGFTLAPTLGTVTAHLISLRAPFLLFAVATAAVAVGLFVVPVPHRPISLSARPSLALLRIPQVRVAALLATAAFLPIGVYDALWARYLEDRGASNLFVGVTLTAYSVPFILLARTGGRFADRVGPRRVAFRMFFALVPIIVAYGASTKPWMIATVGIAEAVINSFASPAVQATMARAAPPDQVAAGQGLAGAMGLLAAGAVSVLATRVYESAGGLAVFSMAAGLVVIVVLAAANEQRRAERPVPAAA